MTSLAEETLRLYRRYQTEIVEELNLCPWAKRARLDGNVRESVCLEPSPAPEALLSTLDGWTAEPAVQIGLILLPKVTMTRPEFEQFATRVMAADAARHTLRSPDFVLAAFHPEAPANLSSAETLIPLLRRTPDPTLQAVRVSALERVRRGEVAGTQYVDPKQLDLALLAFQKTPTLRERVSASNLETVQTLGLDRILALLQDIQQDHARTRAALAQQTAPADPSHGGGTGAPG